MFGYVRPAQMELRMKEFRAYRGVYCGVCHALGRRCSRACRLFLQFDFALLAIVVDLSLEEGLALLPGRCAAMPLQRLTVAHGEAVDYAADAHGLLLYGKSLDDALDGGAGRLLRAPLRRWTRGAAQRRPLLAQGMEAMLEGQREAEAKNMGYTQASEPFAAFCSLMFSPPTAAPEDRQALAWFGLNVGRWIFFADALDDYDEDKKRGRPNPLLCLSRAEAAEAILPEMGLCLRQATAALDLLPAHRLCAVAENIVSEGLYDAAEAIEGGTFRRQRHGEAMRAHPR